MKSAKQTFHDLLKSFHTAVLVSHKTPRNAGAHDGGLHARPMAIAHVAENLDVFFVTSVGSPKIDEVGLDSHVEVVCQGKSATVALAGTATLSRDPALIAELWSDAFRAWFPNGKDDPNLVVLVVHPEEGEYWDQHGVNKLRYVVEALKAVVTGQRPELPKEEHAKARLQPPRP